MSIASGRALPQVELGRRYRIGESLGRGAISEAFAARDEHLDREVVVEKLFDGAVRTLQLFGHELAVLARLDHPAIPVVTEAGRDADGRPFRVLRPQTGESLARLIAAPAPARELLEAFVDVCLAVEHAHQRGVIHRDLGAERILIGACGEVFVTRWGSARVLDAVTDEAPTIGPVHAAPEIAAPDADARVDVFALGCILREIVVLDPAFVLPLEPWCARATAIDRAERLGTARELADGVRAVVAAAAQPAPAIDIDGLLEADDEATVRRHSRLAYLAYLAYLAFVPTLFMRGQVEYGIALMMLVGLNMGVLAIYAYTETPPGPAPIIIGNAALCALIARMTSPFLVAPAIATITTMAIAMSASWRRVRGIAVLVAVMASALLLPVLAERLGWLDGTAFAGKTSVVLTGPAIRANPAMQLSMMPVVLLAVLAAAGGLGHAIRRAERLARRRLVEHVIELHRR